MKKILYSLLFISMLSSAYSQSFIRGTISDSKSKETIVGASVIIDDTTGTTTDINGNYLIQSTAGKHKLLVKYIGYKNYQTTLELKPSDTLVYNSLLEAVSKQLDVVVVSAGRFEQKIEDVTVSMEVIRPQLIENKAIQNLDKAMDYVPGVNIVDGQANIRGGAGFTYGAGSRVLLVVDDMPMLSADAGDIKWSFLPIENCEQIEVIKGASSALFGSSAMNGVIHFRTNYAKEEPETKINFYSGIYDKPKRKELVWWSGSNPTYSGLNFYHAEKIKNLDWVIGGNAHNDEGFKKFERSQRYRLNTNLRYRFKKVEGLSVGLNLNGQLTQSALFLIWNGPDSALVPRGNKPLDQIVGKRFTIDPFLVYNTKHNSKHTLRGRLFRVDNRNPNNVTNSTKGAVSDLYYSEYQFQKRFENNLTWTSGVVYIYSEIQALGLYGNHFSNNAAIFTQFDKKYKKLNLSFGIRGEYFKMDSLETKENINFLFDASRPIAKHSKVKPVMRAGVNYRLLQYTNLRASFGQGYRFPSVAEKYVRSNGGGIEVYPNDSLNPETGWSAEIGIKQGVALGKNWKGFFDVSGFISEYRNMMEFTFGVYGKVTDPMFGTGFKSKNIGNTRILGFETSFMGQGKVGNVNITALLGYTYIDPRQTDFVADSVSILLTTAGTSLLKYRYEHSGKADIEFGYKKISTGFSARVNSFMANIDFFFENEFFFPGLKEYRKQHNKGDAILDYRISYQMHEKVKVSFIINNFLNREVMGRPADIQQPRVFALQLTAKF